MVSGWRKFSRGGRKLGLELVPGLLYGVRTILVTSLVAERVPARRGRRSRRRRGLQHDGEDEDELVLAILDEGVRLGFGPCWACGCWAALQASAGLPRPDEV
jgi:hypothetical protein